MIIAGKEENVLEQISLLWHEFPTWVSDVTNMQSALEMIMAVGTITGKKTASENLVQQIETQFANLPLIDRGFEAAYLIWRKPYMTVGGDTYIHDMMARAGLKNVFANTRRYPAVSVADIRASGCKVVLLSSEPYPFNEKHKAELEEALPGVMLLLVDGEMFSWYGSRLLHAPAYFKSIYLALQKTI
jgi:ABC-type Fe3+-hydroxamate transport system substrate-binding protein